jgi:hypothetical protein
VGPKGNTVDNFFHIHRNYLRQADLLEQDKLQSTASAFLVGPKGFLPNRLKLMSRL